MSTPVTNIYASDIVSTFDIYKPEYMNKLFAASPHNISMYQKFMSMTGFTLPSASTSVRHFENRDWHSPITVRSIVSDPGVGNTASITLAVSDVDASNRFYPQVGDLVYKFDTGMRGRVDSIDVTTPSAPVLVLKLNDPTNTWGAFAANEKLMIYSSVSSEGSGQPKSRFTGVDQYIQYLQIIKETLTYTGTELTNQDWIDMYEEDGKKFLGYWNMGLMDCEARMALKVDGAAIFGEKSIDASNIDPVTNRPYRTSDGLDIVTTNRGQTHEYANSGHTMSDFDSYDTIFDTQRVYGNVFYFLGGTRLYQGVENGAKDYLADTNVNFTRSAVTDMLFGGNQSLALSVNFKAITKSTRTYVIDKMPMFDDPYTGGASANNEFSETGYILPLGFVRDSVTNQQLPTFGFRYKQLGKNNRRMETWSVGGVGEKKITEFDNNNIYFRSDVAAQFTKAKHFIKLTKGN